MYVPLPGGVVGGVGVPPAPGPHSGGEGMGIGNPAGTRSLGMHIGMLLQLSPKPKSWANWSQVIGGVHVPSVTAAAVGVVVGGGQSESGNWHRPPRPGTGTHCGGGAGTQGSVARESGGSVAPVGRQFGSPQAGSPMPGRESQFGTAGTSTAGATGACWT